MTEPAWRSQSSEPTTPELTFWEHAPVRKRKPLGLVLWLIILTVFLSSTGILLRHMISAVSVFYLYQYRGTATYSSVQWDYASEVQEVAGLNIFDVISGFHPAVVKVSQR